jgi:hypothetical protein
MAATTTRRKTQSKKADKPKAAEPKVEQIKLADLEAEIVTTLKSEGVQPAAVDKTLLKRWNNVCDEGRLQFYTAPRYGSKHNSDWISPAVVKRVQKAIAS